MSALWPIIRRPDLGAVQVGHQAPKQLVPQGEAKKRVCEKVTGCANVDDQTRQWLGFESLGQLGCVMIIALEYAGILTAITTVPN